MKQVRKLSSLKRSCGAFRPFVEGYAGQGWRNGVPPEFWPGATVGSAKRRSKGIQNLSGAVCGSKLARWEV